MAVNREDVLAWLSRCAQVLDENKAYLTDLDSAIGDADHGINIARGFKTVVAKLEESDGDLAALFKTTAMTLMSAVGGASGMLYGNFFMKAATVAGGKEALARDDLLALLRAGVDGIVQRGRAELGDKTMIDVWLPALDALGRGLDAGEDLPTALQSATQAAQTAMVGTIPLQARKGRASYLGERSVGHQDPGATSSYMIIDSLRHVLAGE
jgi:dihydroxyacetone kinase-like protein